MRIILVIFSILSCLVYADDSSSSSTTTTSVGVDSFSSDAMTDFTNGIYSVFGLPSTTSSNLFTTLNQYFGSWSASLNNFVFSDSTTIPPITPSVFLAKESTQKVNMMTNATPALTTNYATIVRYLLRGTIGQILESSQSSSTIISASESVSSNFSFKSLSNYCSSDDWSYRFSTHELNVLCQNTDSNSSNYAMAGEALSAFSSGKFSNDLYIYQLLLYYQRASLNCYDSVTSMPTSDPSSTSDSTGTGSSMSGINTDPSSSSNSIPFVQCYTSTSGNNWVYEVAHNFQSSLKNVSVSDSTDADGNTSDTQSALTDLQTCVDNVVTSIDSSGLVNQTFQQTYDQNGTINSLYSGPLSNLNACISTAITNFESGIISEVVAANDDIKPQTGIIPSIDVVLLPTYYTSSSTCDPTKGIDTSFTEANLNEGDDNALSFINNLIVGIDIQPSDSPLEDMSTLTSTSSSSTSTTTSVRFMGGWPIYCDANYANSDSTAYNWLCCDSDGNCNTGDIDVQSFRQGISSSINSNRDASNMVANATYSYTSAGYANLFNIYMQRKLVGNVTGCTPTQLDSYYATHRYTDTVSTESNGDVSWTENVQTLADTETLQREQTLLLQDINYQLFQIKKLLERSLATNSIEAVYGAKAIIDSGATANQMIQDDVKAYDTVHQTTPAPAS